MKPNWSFIWEYTHPLSGTRMRTPDPLTAGELTRLVGQPLADLDARPVEETRVDRHEVPYRDSSLIRKAPMPEFKAPTTKELRAYWHAYPDVRRLLLEIVALRKSLSKIQEWYDVTERSVKDKGEMGGPHGPFQKLRHLLRAEQERAGMK